MLLDSGKARKEKWVHWFTTNNQVITSLFFEEHLWRWKSIVIVMLELALSIQKKSVFSDPTVCVTVEIYIYIKILFRKVDVSRSFLHVLLALMGVIFENFCDFINEEN